MVRTYFKASWWGAFFLFIVVVGASLGVSSDGPGDPPTIHNKSNGLETDECRHDPQAFRCVQYIKNYDADTLTVSIPNVHPLLGEKIAVRVRHIDAPEMRGSQPCEKEASRTARRLTEKLLKKARRIDLVNVGRDKYFRVLADVIVDGKSLADVLLKNKLAYPYEGGTKLTLTVNWCASSAARVPSGD